MIEPEVLFDKLAGLESPQEIREFCQSQGVQGYISDESSCVLARLFKLQTGVEHIQVNGHIQWSKEFTEDFGDVDVWGEQREVTEPMRDFIRLFDDSRYPELVAEIDHCY